MKRTIYILSALLMLASCKPDPVDDPVNIPLGVDVDVLTFTAEGGEQNFTVTTSEKLYLVPGEGWIKTRQGEKSPDNKIIVTVTAEVNDTFEERSTRISVVAGEEKLYVDVVQEAKTFVPEPEPVPGDNTAWKIAEKLGIGWNLGNQMDAHINGVSDETCWGNPKTTKALFDWLKEYGFKSVRIPVTWMGHVNGAPYFSIDEDWMNRVAEIVGYAEQAGLNAIINMHHDGADSNYWLDIATAAVNPQIHA